MRMTIESHTDHDDLTHALTTGSGVALTTRFLGHPLRYVPVIASTQPVVHMAAQEGANEGLVVLTDEQTAGKGRLGRTWQAPFGSSLLLSMLFRPNLHPQQGGRLTMCVGLGAATAIEEMTGLSIQLKWPNDLLLHGRKLAGVLTETQLDGDRMTYAVVGLGLNVNLTRPPDDELAATATSLSHAMGRSISRLALLQTILRHVEAHYERLQAGHSPYAAWSQRMAYQGQRVQVTLPHMVLTGTVTGANPDGALLIQDDHGAPYTVWAGDVTLLDRAPSTHRDFQ